MLIVFGAAIILIDQLTKLIALKKIPNQGIFLIDKKIGQLKLILISNPEIAFGWYLPAILITLLLILIVIILIRLIYKSWQIKNQYQILVLTAILGAALSNILDRFIHGGVIDFISITLYNFQWATFNLADVFITSSVILLIIPLLKKKI